MTLLLALHALVAMVIIASGDRLGRRAFVGASVAPLVTLGWLARQMPRVLDGGAVVERHSWVGRLGLGIDWRLDGFGALMVLLIAGVGVIVFAYAYSYFGPDQPGVARLAGLLTLFAGSMLGVVLADDIVLLYCCWELTSVTSYLLIGNNHTDPRARAAALHALLVTGAGGLTMLAGLVILGRAAGTWSLSEIVANPPSGSVVSVALVLIGVGALTKSAQYPFHSWLPGAMAAPTPVSAYLHSATMVKAGVYLVARLAPAFADQGAWRPLVLGIAAATTLFGGLRAVRQHDLKLLLAFGTVSQLGLMMAVFSAGTSDALIAGSVLLLAHGAFKAALFLVVGMIDHETGTRDIRSLPDLDRRWLVVKVVTAVSLLSMAGIAPFLGFVAKESAYDTFVRGGFAGSTPALAVIVVGSMFTFAYSARFWWGAFVGPRRAGRPVADHAPSVAFMAPAVALGAFTVVLGLMPGTLDRLTTSAARSLDPSADSAHLALWHGVNTTLWLSGLTVAGGVVLFLGRAPVARLLKRGANIPAGDEVFVGILRGVDRVSARVTGIVQNGSLPVYAGVILFTAAALPGLVLWRHATWPGWPAMITTWAHVPVAVLLVGSALSAAAARRRFSAAVFLGVAGYAMAALFVIQGAPDLALTQTAIETLSTVLFVLVLRHLPDGFERVRSPGSRVIRVLIAAMVGVVVFVFAILSGSEHSARPVADEMIARSLPDGHGRNVVNVILVDFRGLDTLGEITVLAAAAIGAVALARAGRGHGPRVESDPVTRPVRASKPGGRIERLVFVDVSVRLIFHTVMIASLWLLFAGHNQPGGGFVGGLLAGAAISLRFVAGGIDEVRAHVRYRPWTILGTGLLLAASTAAAPLVFGRDVLEATLWHLDVPVLGAVKLTSALPFDVGVYLLVLGLVLMVFEAFGDEPKEALA